MSDERERAEQEAAGVVIHDRRRIDPLTGAVRPTASAAPATTAPATTAPATTAPATTAPGTGAPEAAGATGSDPTGAGSADAADQVTLLQMELAERTHDLQRVQAEYQNYRRRVDRDREAVRDLAVANLVNNLLPILDDIGRAAEHGELVGGFKSVADALAGVLSKLGVELFGEVGEPFDPARHEALLHTYSDEVTQTTCTQVFQPGYRLRDRVLRPARVAVADPTEALPPTLDTPADGAGTTTAASRGADRESAQESPRGLDQDSSQPSQSQPAAGDQPRPAS